MWCVPPPNEPAGHEKWRYHRQHYCSGVALAMSGWLVSLATWLRLPRGCGVAELDMQIKKLRTLRDSYQLPSQKYRSDRIADVNPLCGR